MGKNKNNKKSRNLVIFTLIIILLFIALFVLNQMTEKSTGQEGVTAFENAPAIKDQPTLGSSDAKISIVEFGDFKCPSCKAWGQQMMPRLVTEYVDSGKASFSYVNVLFHGEESELASLAAESVLLQAPDDYWTFHKALFAAQPSSNHDSQWVTVENILKIAEASIPEVDLDQLEKDLNRKNASTQVSSDVEMVKAFNVRQTPTIMINNKQIENPFEYNKIIEVIESELK